MTVNMEIDAELMAAAAEEEKSVADAFGADVANKMFDESSAEVETIIMEGEFVRSAIDKERLAAESDARSQIDEYGKLADTYVIGMQLIDSQDVRVINRLTESFRGDVNQLIKAARFSTAELLGLPRDGQGRLTIAADAEAAATATT